MAEKVIQITYNEFAEKGALAGIQKTMVETALKVHASATTIAEKDTSQMANSIMVQTNKEELGFNSVGGQQAATDKLSTKAKELEYYVGTNVDHGVYQEFGTRHMKAQPFMRPAGEEVQGGNVAAIAKKYGNEAMKEEFEKRKVKVRNG